MSNKNNHRFFSGKGYYIALILCAAAIGISGYVYYNSTADAEPDPGLDTPVIATDAGQVSVNKPAKPTESTKPTDAAAPTVGKMTTCAPVEGEVLAEYAMECLAYNQTTRDWRVHNGVDIAAEAGTKVVAAADGQVYTVYEDDQMGHTVVIRHDNGYVTKYSSLSGDIKVTPGETVTMGQTIGTVGSTALMETALGDHVHFSVTCNDEPVDPEEFIGA